MRKSPSQHKVTRKTKSGKVVTYMRGKGAKGLKPAQAKQWNWTGNIKKDVGILKVMERKRLPQEKVDTLMAQLRAKYGDKLDKYME